MIKKSNWKTTKIFKMEDDKTNSKQKMPKNFKLEDDQKKSKWKTTKKFKMENENKIKIEDEEKMPENYFFFVKKSKLGYPEQCHIHLIFI